MEQQQVAPATESPYMDNEQYLNEALERHKRIVTRQRAIEITFLEQGEDLYELNRLNQFECFGYDTFDAYVASVEVNIGRRMAYMCRGVYETFVLIHEVDREFLVDIGISKLDLIRPIVTGHNLDEWLNKASALSRSDLKTEIAEFFNNGVADEPDDDTDESVASNGNTLTVFRACLTDLLNFVLRIRPDLANAPVVRAAANALKMVDDDSAP